MSCNRIAFVCDIDLPNYLDKPEAYEYLEGKHSATGYYYWILKNHGVTNIDLVGVDSNLNDYDIVIIYYDNKDVLPKKRKFKTIQVVSDRPQIPNIDLYICCNQSTLKPILNLELVRRGGLGLHPVLTGKWHFIHYPMALHYKKCTPQWPPSIYHFTGRSNTLITGIYDSKFIEHMKNRGINLRFDFKNDHNHGDEDVYFCVRNNKTYYSPVAGGNNVDTILGQKTANRLYQSWKMGTPSIFNSNTAMFSIRKSEHDFLIADSLDEFEYSCLKLKTDCTLFNRMVDVCHSRQHEHSNEVIVKQWIDAFSMVTK
ncbi:MAG: hypothetical protein EBU90_29560 [Proteobacteria bacterium]|nr:hypothetical protein [Pseudomonadota bacterium]